MESYMGFNMLQPTNPTCPKIKVIKFKSILQDAPSLDSHQVLIDSHRNRTWTVRFGSFSNSRTVASRVLCHSCHTQSVHFVVSGTKWASIRRHKIQADTPENHGHLKVPKQLVPSLLVADAHREGSWAKALESLCTDCRQRESKKFKEKCSKRFGNKWCSLGYTSERSLHYTL